MRELKKATAAKIPLAADLVLYLNGRDVLRHNGRASEASRKRIFDLFENVKRALASVAKGPNYLVGFTPSDFYRFVRKMDRLLADYPTINTFMRNRDGEYVFESVVGGGRKRLMEAVAAHGIINLAKARKLQRVRLCVCGDWFVGQRDNQRSCSAGCRHKLYEQSETYKKRRRAYMREYYALRKTGKVK
jgi:hypothetical protein